MTLNLSLVTRGYAICVTDRRLSHPLGGVISERGNKLTLFECANARGFVTYNGIGRDLAGQSPNDWLAENPLLAKLPFIDFVRAVRNITITRLAPIAAQGYDTRHSCILAGFVNNVPSLAMVSNYESLAQDGWQSEAAADLSIDFMAPNSESAGAKLLLATGSFPVELKRRFINLGEKASDISEPGSMRARMIKLVRDVAYRADRKASVGTSVMTAVIPVKGEAEVSNDVVGGTTLHEMPNLIAPYAAMKDIYIDTSGNYMSRYSRIHKKALIKEYRCAGCGGPVPDGYARCGICDAPAPQKGAN